MFSEADRWTLGNLLSRSADFCMSLASFHNNMFLTVKEAGRFLKNAAVPVKGGRHGFLCACACCLPVQMLIVDLRRKVWSKTE